MRNIEIKAKIHDPETIIAKVKELNASNCVIIKQHDTFFTTPDGRLKLRKFEDGTGELIYYKRSDTTGPKLCNYEKTFLDGNACSGIRNILDAAYGCVGIVKKTRQLFMIDQTRVHIDEVDGLGKFMELEVVLYDDQDTETGEKIAQNIMDALGIGQQDLIAEAYIDLIHKPEKVE